MVLGIKELHKLVKEIKLVENLSERELTNPEGAGFDLRIGELFALDGQGVLGEAERATPELKSLASYVLGKKPAITIEPQTYYVMKTIERVNTPLDIAILFRPRSTL